MWAISQIKRQLQERRAKYEAQTPEEKAAWRTANATVWIAIFTIVLAIVGGITLYEVIAGGNDTHGLAEAAKKQASATVQQMGFTAALALVAKDQADRTKDLADRMKDQADRTKTIAEQAVIQAQAAKSSAETARDELTTNGRPWLGVDGSLTIRRIEIKTVVIEEARHIQNHVVVEPDFTIKNFGNAPAFMVTSDIRQVSTQNLSDVPEYFKEIRTSQDTSCTQADASSTSTGKENGGMIYPSNSQNSAVVAIAYIHGGPPNTSEKQTAPLVLVGCISYRDQFTIRHHTTFCFTSDVPMSSLVKGDSLRQCTRNQDAN